MNFCVSWFFSTKLTTLSYCSSTTSGVKKTNFTKYFSHAVKCRQWLAYNLLIFKKEYKDKVYKLIKFIFDHTNSTLNFKTIDKTVKLVNKHFDGSISTHKYFLFVYYAMVAEEKKTNSKLGKRIKLLGIYQILNENFSSQTAANFSRGLKWTVIDEECKRRGF